MVADLEDREVLGGNRVIVGFDGVDLVCEEETDVFPGEVADGGSVLSSALEMAPTLHLHPASGEGCAVD